MMKEILSYTTCTLCPRRCAINRKDGPLGVCKEHADVRVARASLHFGEEPPLSQAGGSGAVFFTGCNLNCRYCQNDTLTKDHFGKNVSIERLSNIFLELQQKGAQNINLVTGTHFIPSIIDALKRAKDNGLALPIVWNTSGYESQKTIQALFDYVDVWLFDVKYADANLAKALSQAPTYPQIAQEALSTIGTQLELTGGLQFTSKGAMQKGLIVRHLVLPGFLDNTKEALSLIRDSVGTEYPLSLMSQYTPNEWAKNQTAFPSLAHPLSSREYNEAKCYAQELGFETLFLQDLSSNGTRFIPEFDGFGI